MFQTYEPGRMFQTYEPGRMFQTYEPGRMFQIYKPGRMFHHFLCTVRNILEGYFSPGLAVGLHEKDKLLL